MKKLIEIALFTPDVKRTAEFYRVLLGMSPTYESDEAAEFNLGGTKLFIHVKGQSERPEPGFPPGVDHVAFSVEDLDEACKSLSSHGLSPAYGPETYYWGRSAYYLDPNGRLVELHKPEKAGSSQRTPSL